MVKSWKWIDAYERARDQGHSVAESKAIANRTGGTSKKSKGSLFDIRF